MSRPADHCPFLNRSDERCAQHQRLDHLGHMMRFCCDRYQECPTYVGLLIERQVKRSMAASREVLHDRRPSLSTAAPSPTVQLTVSVRRAGRRSRIARAA